MKNVLIIGYGSIGKVHAKVLSELKFIKKIYILTSQRITKYSTISKISQIKEINPFYIVMANETSLHYEQFLYLNKNFANIKILIEKPIFHKYYKLNTSINNQVYVGYNLRFHPIILFLKKLLQNKKILSVNIFCGSYLPNWRKNRNYEDTSSAKKIKGGGVLLDLSHEMDYVLLLFGKINNFFAINKKISKLKIDSDDFLNFIGITQTKVQINLSLNYFSLINRRKIIIDCDNMHIIVDLINNKINYYKNKKIISKKFNKLNKYYTYKKMHYDYLMNKTNNLCSINEALLTMKLIEKIKSK